MKCHKALWLQAREALWPKLLTDRRQASRDSSCVRNMNCCLAPCAVTSPHRRRTAAGRSSGSSACSWSQSSEPRGRRTRTRWRATTRWPAGTSSCCARPSTAPAHEATPVLRDRLRDTKPWRQIATWRASPWPGHDFRPIKMATPFYVQAAKSAFSTSSRQRLACIPFTPRDFVLPII